MYQVQSPNSFIVDGNSAARTIVASIRTAIARPTPSCLNAISLRVAKMENTSQWIATAGPLSVRASRREDHNASVRSRGFGGAYGAAARQPGRRRRLASVSPDVLSLAARGSPVFSRQPLAVGTERYGCLVLEVEDPEADIARIQQAASGDPGVAPRARWRPRSRSGRAAHRSPATVVSRLALRAGTDVS
jgi:hypothetical protein